MGWRPVLWPRSSAFGHRLSNLLGTFTINQTKEQKKEKKKAMLGFSVIMSDGATDDIEEVTKCRGGCRNRSNPVVVPQSGVKVHTTAPGSIDAGRGHASGTSHDPVGGRWIDRNPCIPSTVGCRRPFRSKGDAAPIQQLNRYLQLTARLPYKRNQYTHTDTTPTTRRCASSPSSPSSRPPRWPSCRSRSRCVHRVMPQSMPERRGRVKARIGPRTAVPEGHRGGPGKGGLITDCH